MTGNKLQTLVGVLLGVLLPTSMASAGTDSAVVGPVTAEKTLWQLAKTVRGDSPYSVYQTIIALKLKNPTAFVGENVHHLQLGAVLLRPTEAEIAAIPPQAAQTKVDDDETYWRQWLGAGKRQQPQAAPWLATTATNVGHSASSVAHRHQLAPTNPVQSVHGDPINNDPEKTAKVNLQVTSQDTSELKIESDSTLSVETRFFPKNGAQGQSQWAGSAAFLQEWYWRSEDEKSSWVVSPYGRIDAEDQQRHLFDIRQAYWLQVGDSWELKAGLDQVFWGVTESQHLVDVVNQTDLADRPDGETKLGQPLIQLNLLGEWGSLQTLVLPWFRERTVPGESGRLRLPLPIEQDEAVYESQAKQQHVDWAVRYSKQLDQLDIAISYFDGTSRDPLLLVSPEQILPYYPQMQQWGLEGQWIVDSWLWKLEAIQRKTTQSSYSAYTTGFEYSAVGVIETIVDVGWIVEYQYDSRGQDALTPAQRDLFLGTRIAFNDEAGSELLMGLGQDLQNGATRIGKVEGSSRLSNNVRVRFDAWMFQTDAPTDPIWWFRRDDYVQLGLDYYF